VGRGPGRRERQAERKRGREIEKGGHPGTERQDREPQSFLPAVIVLLSTT
jgi:hypothetical protein